MIDHIFGLSIRYKPWDKKSILPLYIVSNYQFYTAYIENIRCIVIIPIEELPTLPSLKKQIQKIRVIDDVLSYYIVRQYHFIEERVFLRITFLS